MAPSFYAFFYFSFDLGILHCMTDIEKLVQSETRRQSETLTLIPSENYTYPDVRKIVGSPLMHKYSEGYPGKRYYNGNKYMDEIESIAVSRAKDLFGVPHVNVQPHSGSPANAAVYMALLKPGDTIMGLELNSGGHLTHGHPNITFSGKFFKSVQYGVLDNGYIDYEKLRTLAQEVRPNIIVAGTTAYPRKLDFKRFSEIAEEVGAYLLADISHIAGLVVTGNHENPVSFCDVITTTTHKMLRGPRGAIVMVTEKGMAKNPKLPSLIDRAVFPGLQGGPHMNTIAAIAQTLEHAGTSAYRSYATQIVKNADVLSRELMKHGMTLVTGGTDNHLMLIDVSNMGLTGREAADALEAHNIIVNANTIPNDPGGPRNPFGIRIGTPAVTSRGLGALEMKMLAKDIYSVLVGRGKVLPEVRSHVAKMCSEFPIDLS